MESNRWLVLAIAIIVLLIGALFYPVFAHEHSRPDLDKWFGELSSKGGGPCCGGPKVDATVLEDPDWENVGGHYRVRIDGEWIDVPDSAVVERPNLFGKTLVWPYRRWGLEGKQNIEIRCFIPGVMT